MLVTIGSVGFDNAFSSSFQFIYFCVFICVRRPYVSGNELTRHLVVTCVNEVTS